MADGRIDGDRLLGRLRALAASAPGAAGGVTRLSWSPADLAGRALLTGWLAVSGVSARIDAAGNLIAELPGTEDGLAPLVSGSHLDSVVDGGALDGAYGALAAFEVVAALAEAGERLRHPLRAVAWVNEEGVVAPPFTGSMVAASRPVDLAATGPDGVRLGERMAAAGDDPAGLAAAAWDGIAGYLELHIEQGPVLHRSGHRAGAVTGITGSARGWITFDGTANHAGTTPMDLRADALVAAAHAVLVVQRLATDGPVDVATTGALDAQPGNGNVIAGRARVSYDLRSLDDSAVARALDRLRGEVEGIAGATGTRVAISPTSSSAAVRTDPMLLDAVVRAAARLDPIELASGAGHDAQHVAALGPVGMIFVPSIGGVSHSPAEATDPADLVAGAEVLLDALRLADVA